MNNQLFIPDRINVGYNQRNDTYTGKLAYVIYFDKKGVLRKEASWNSWRDQKLGNNEFENKPISGFVLNKKVGGTRGHSWEQRQTYSRVYDPRGFEFEITVPNLLFILQECDCSRGKGLEGEFVYAWQGTDLILLPVTSQEYQSSLEFTALKSQKVAAKDLILGATYQTKNQRNVIYLGKFQYFEYSEWQDSDHKVNAAIYKPYVFWQEKKQTYEENLVIMRDLSQLANCVVPTTAANYAELVDICQNDKHFGQFTRLNVIDFKIDKLASESWRVKANDYTMPGLYHQRIDENTFAEYRLVAHDGERENRGYYSYGFTYKKCQLNQTRVITFNNDGTIDFKEKAVKGQMISASEAKGMLFQQITFGITNNKKFKTFKI